MPIRQKVTLVILLTCSIVLLLACAFLAGYQILQYRSAVIRDTTVLADVLAENIQAALRFQDEKAAAKTLKTLEAEPNVAAACVYSRDGTLFARYTAVNSKEFFPARPPGDGTRFEASYLIVVRPVMVNNKRVGTLLLRNDLQGLTDRLKMFGLVAGVVLLISGAAALALASPLQRTISQPIIALSDAMRSISGRKDYTVRLPAQGTDETGQLTTAFNQLLAGIAERDAALVAANESLRHSEAQLQSIVENINEGLIVSDLDGNLVQFNRAALALHGMASREEFRRDFRALQDTFELTGLDGAIWPVDKWPLARILRGETVRNLEVRFRRLPGGAPRVYSYGGTVIRDANGAPVMAVVTMSDITERKMSEYKVGEQLARMALLNQITRATGERLDLPSIFQVVVRTVEDQLPADFCCICLHDTEARVLSVASIGAGTPMILKRGEQLPIGENGLSQCAGGVLVSEADVSNSKHPFPQRLAEAGLRAFVAAPLLVESHIFGVLIAARKQPESFSSGECEFLRQLSEHVALAAHQAQLHTALQQAYDDLRQTQQAVMQQERLRALGQMASGIAHDINNAISPVALYTESLLETEPNLSARARDYLETIQHAIEDVAQTVARMREFYRQREPQLTLLPVQLNRPGAAGDRSFPRPLERHAATARSVHRTGDGTGSEPAGDRRGGKRNPRGPPQSRLQCRGCHAGGRKTDGADEIREAFGQWREPAGQRGGRGLAIPARAWTRTRAAAVWSRFSPPRASAARAWAWPWSMASPSATGRRLKSRANRGAARPCA